MTGLDTLNVCIIYVAVVKPTEPQIWDKGLSYHQLLL